MSGLRKPRTIVALAIALCMGVLAAVVTYHLAGERRHDDRVTGADSDPGLIP